MVHYVDSKKRFKLVLTAVIQLYWYSVYISPKGYILTLGIEALHE